MIQEWLKALANTSIFDEAILLFFQIDFDLVINPKVSLAIDDFFVLEYVKSIQKNKKNRLGILKEFSEKIFGRRRGLHSVTMKKMLVNLLPLCGEEVISGLALDFISKITSREFYYEFEKIRNELLRIEIKHIKSMHLEEFILGNRFSQGQLQAYQLVSLLTSHCPNYANRDEISSASKISEIVRVI